MIDNDNEMNCKEYEEKKNGGQISIYGKVNMITDWNINKDRMKVGFIWYDMNFGQ